MRQPTQIEGIELDFDRSTVIINGVPYPAVGVIFPREPGECYAKDGDGECKNCPRTETGCILGGTSDHTQKWSKGWQVMIPMENGALVCLSIDKHTRKDEERSEMVLEVWLYARYVYINPSDTMLNGGMDHLGMVDGKIVRPRLRSGRAATWRRPDPEWLVELLDRLATKELVFQPNEHEVSIGLVPIGHPLVRPLYDDVLA